ncbi:MAG: hypothetical protein AAFV85_26915 [Cyanobacteria bacterium J06634_6]
MKIVVFRPEACSPPRGSRSVLKLDTGRWRLTLTPGDNSISDDDADKLQKHSDFARYNEQGAIAVKDAKGSPSPSDSTTAPVSLSHLNTDEAEALIGKTDNVELLQKWLKAETRKTTRGDLDRRIEQLTTA